MSEFFRTQMGHRFFEHTVPDLVRSLARIGDMLERIGVAREKAEERREREAKDEASG